MMFGHNRIREIRHAHMFCGVGGGAMGFNRAAPRVGHVQAKFVCAGGIDVDPGAIRNFERLTGAKGTVMDLFDRQQYMAFHGREPANDFREATPADIRLTFGPGLDVVFLSAPCKGFSGLLSASQSKTDKYQALNRLTLRGVWLLLEAYKDDPVPVVLFENVPRILTRGRWLLDQITALFRAYGYCVNLDTHDCGVIGNLAQSRKRALLIARHMEKIPPFIYQPREHALRGVGDVIGKLPLPGDPVAGPMHRVPALQWKTWVRLALVPAGKDWRALNDLAVVDGNLRDYGIAPEVPLRENALGVNAWDDTAPVITSHRAPGQGRFSVADPRVDTDWNADVLGVREWDQATGTVAGRNGVTNGAYSVADPRQGASDRASTYGVKNWDEPSGTVAGESFPTNGAFSVADPRPPAGANQTYQQYGVNGWDEAAGTVSGQSAPGGGAHSIADPRLRKAAHKNVYRVVPFDRHAGVITSSRHGAVADPRPPRAHSGTKYQVTQFDGASRTVIGASTTGDGAFAVADPRPTCLNKPEREGYSTQGHYGVVGWEEHSKAIPGHAKNNNGSWSVADPRETLFDCEPILLPQPDDRLVCRIIALDGTWHRPFTTLDLGALQALFDPEEIFYQEQTEQGLAWMCRTLFDLVGGSDVTKREWIGNMVPGAAAEGMANTIGETFLLADQGQTFQLSSREIWVKPGALALAVDNDQPAFRLDRGDV
jgi:site-specific DNA-cytosine methylase